MSRIPSILQPMLDRPVLFHPSLARMLGSVTAALMLSQALYWSGVQERTNEGVDGWFFKTQREWEEETCLTRHEQDGARKLLRRFDFWQEERRDAPAKMHYRIDLNRLAMDLSQCAEKPQTRLPKTGNLECRKVSNKIAENPQSLKGTESTTEITTEIKARAQTARPANPLMRKAPKLQPQQVAYAQTAGLARIGEKMLRDGEVRELGDLKERLKDIAAAKGMERYGDPCSNASDIAMRRFEGAPPFSRGSA